MSKKMVFVIGEVPDEIAEVTGREVQQLLERGGGGGMVILMPPSMLDHVVNNLLEQVSAGMVTGQFQATSKSDEVGIRRLLEIWVNARRS